MMISALQALVESFTRAYNARDAKTLATLFTTNARLSAGEGNITEGRDAIEKLFTTLFQDDPGQSITIQVEYLRLLSPDAAIEEGISNTTSGDKAMPVQKSRYTVAYVKRDGRWLQDYLREVPLKEDKGASTPTNHLEELSWMIGEWIDQSADAEVETTCNWSDDRTYLVRSFAMKVQGKVVLSGTQRIGWDPQAQQIKSWVHDSSGAFSQGSWSRDGDRWVIKTSGVTKDGQTASATNIFTRFNQDTLSWSSVDRTAGSTVLPNAETIIMVRKPPRPSASPKPRSSQTKAAAGRSQ